MIQQLQRDFSGRNKLCRQLEDIAYLRREPQVPKAYQATTIKTRSPLALHIVNTITAALSINAPKTQFDPVQIGTTGEENASLREHFFDASWQRQQEEAKRPLFRRFVHATVLKGEGVVKTVERTKRAWASYNAYAKRLDAQMADPKHPEYGAIARQTRAGDYSERDRVYNAKTEEAKRALPYPIASTDVPPETFYPVRGEDGFSFCAEVKKVPYYETLTRYGMSLDRGGHVVSDKPPDGAALGLPQNDWARCMSGETTLTMYEAWDWQSCLYLLQGPGDQKAKVVREIKHGYGDRYLKTLRGPYFHTYGITTSSTDVDLMGLSVLYGFMDLFPQLDSLLTILGQSAYKYGYATFRRKAGADTLGPPAVFGRDEQDRRNREQEVLTGGILPWDIEPVNLPSSGPDLEKAVAILRQLIELALPQILQGVVNGDESGYMLNQAQHLGSLVFSPIVSNIQVALAERTAFESWLIENRIKETVYVWGEASGGGKARGGPRGYWLGLGPDDLRGVHRYRTTLDVATPSSKVIEVRTHQQLLALRLETPDQAVTELGGNPDEVEKGWLLADVKQALRPEVIQRVQQAIATVEQQKAQQANALEDNSTGPAGTALPDVVQPGQNGVPLEPPPPPGAGGPGPRTGLPEVPNAPGGHIPLPGQG